eukprot:scaffold61607_cov92-Phaeocystis_antarctica.AAC.2
MWPIKGREEHSTLFNTTIFKDVTKDVPGERVYSDQCMWQVLRRANPRSDPSVATLDVTSSTMGMDSSSTTVRIVVLCRECLLARAIGALPHLGAEDDSIERFCLSSAQNTCTLPRMDRAKMRNPKAASFVRLSTHSLTGFHALNLSPHDARRATDADPASGPGIDDTATSRSIHPYHARPRTVDGSDAPADSLQRLGCVQPQHSARAIAPRGYADRGA